MAKVLVVTSGKGGVGKTTSTAALGAALRERRAERSAAKRLSWSISMSAYAISISSWVRNDASFSTSSMSRKVLQSFRRR